MSDDDNRDNPSEMGFDRHRETYDSGELRNLKYGADNWHVRRAAEEELGRRDSQWSGIYGASSSSSSQQTDSNHYRPSYDSGGDYSSSGTGGKIGIVGGLAFLGLIVAWASKQCSYGNKVHELDQIRRDFNRDLEGRDYKTREKARDDAAREVYGPTETYGNMSIEDARRKMEEIRRRNNMRPGSKNIDEQNPSTYASADTNRRRFLGMVASGLTEKTSRLGDGLFVGATLATAGLNWLADRKAKIKREGK